MEEKLGSLDIQEINRNEDTLVRPEPKVKRQTAAVRKPAPVKTKSEVS